jgi:hypothetical protein
MQAIAQSVYDVLHKLCKKSGMFIHLHLENSALCAADIYATLRIGLFARVMGNGTKIAQRLRIRTFWVSSLPTKLTSRGSRAHCAAWTID